MHHKVTFHIKSYEMSAWEYAPYPTSLPPCCIAANPSQKGKKNANRRVRARRTKGKHQTVITMETKNGHIQNDSKTKGLDINAIIGGYDGLNAWKNPPILPKASLVTETLEDKHPTSLYVSIRKSLRPGLKMCYKRKQPMPEFYQGRRYQKLHWGQRKLFMSELQFFTRVLSDIREKALVVYAGAARGGHILYLAELFPNITFHLYDPADFDEKLMKHPQTPKRIYIFRGSNGCFDDNVAQQYAQNTQQRKNAGRLLFISDVRLFSLNTKGGNSVYSRVQNSKKFMENTAKDMDKQLKWTRIIEAEGTLLKFKLPYPDESTPAFRCYIPGTIFFQCWAPTPSSELRLLVLPRDLKKKKDKYYNIPLITGEIDYFNEVMRTEDLGDNDLKSFGIKVNGKMSDIWNKFKLPIISVDACIEAKIWFAYLKKKGSKCTWQSIQESVSWLTLSLGRSAHKDPALIFRKKLNYQKHGENVANYRTPVDMSRLHRKK